MGQPIQAGPAQQGGMRIVRGAAIVFAAKLLALSLLYFMSFSPARRPDVGPGTVESRLLGPDAPPNEARDHD